MRDSMAYLIQKQCPEFYSASGAPSTSPSQVQQEPMTLKKEMFRPGTKGVVGVGFRCEMPSSVASKPGWADYKSDRCFVYQVFEGTPAFADGRMRVGDQILEVNGTRIAQTSTNELQRLISGDAGTYVTIVVQSGGREIPVTIKRKPVDSLNID